MDNLDQRDVAFAAANSHRRATELNSMAPELKALSPDARAEMYTAVARAGGLPKKSEVEALSPDQAAVLNSMAPKSEALSSDVRAEMYATAEQLGPPSHEASPQSIGVRTELDERTRDSRSR